MLNSHFSQSDFGFVVFAFNQSNLDSFCLQGDGSGAQLESEAGGETLQTGKGDNPAATGRFQRYSRH